jgi:predicted protein tyrosine phosphatase
MFKLKICDLYDAVYLSKTWATHTVSLLDPDIEKHNFFIIPVAGENRKLRRYYFHDITPEDSWNHYFRTEFELATPKQIQEILAFTASLVPTDNLLVHCHAGISRSTAVACGILCQHGLTPRDSIKHVLSIRKQAFPNRYILKLFDELLGLEGELANVAFEEFAQSV